MDHTFIQPCTCCCASIHLCCCKFPVLHNYLWLHTRYTFAAQFHYALSQELGVHWLPIEREYKHQLHMFECCGVEQVANVHTSRGICQSIVAHLRLHSCKYRRRSNVRSNSTVGDGTLCVRVVTEPFKALAPSIARSSTGSLHKHSRIRLIQ